MHALIHSFSYFHPYTSTSHVRVLKCLVAYVQGALFLCTLIYILCFFVASCCCVLLHRPNFLMGIMKVSSYLKSEKKEGRGDRERGKPESWGEAADIVSVNHTVYLIILSPGAASDRAAELIYSETWVCFFGLFNSKMWQKQAPKQLISSRSRLRSYLLCRCSDNLPFHPNLHFHKVVNYLLDVFLKLASPRRR